MPTRDSQKQRLYDAEYAVGPFINELGSLEAAQKYVTEVLATAWVQTRWGRHTIRVGRTRNIGKSYDGYITLGVDAQNKRVILHEIAHELSFYKYGYQRNDIAAHGPEFAATYVALVGRFLGADAAAKLRESYRKHRVRFTAPGAVPKPGTHTVVTQAARKAAVKERTTKPLTLLEQREAARLLRRAVASGMFGEPGRKPRTHAQTIARTLEKAGS
jgi:putative metallohydrolase (TIGR04338 family)